MTLLRFAPVTSFVSLIPACWSPEAPTAERFLL